MIKVVIAEDHEIVREGLKSLIEQDNEIKVIGCASDGKEAFTLCKKLLPDIVLMDLDMPGCGGVEGTKLIKSEFPFIKILVLSSFSDGDNVYAALKNGAEGYVHKDIKPTELIQLIKGVKGGMKIVHPNVFFNTMKQLNKNEEVSDTQNDSPSEETTLNISFTDREKSIMELIVKGKSNKEIGETLFLSEGRVKNIISTILEKAGLKDRTQLAVFAVKNKII